MSAGEKKKYKVDQDEAEEMYGKVKDDIKKALGGSKAVKSMKLQKGTWRIKVSDPSIKWVYFVTVMVNHKGQDREAHVRIKEDQDGDFEFQGVKFKEKAKSGSGSGSRSKSKSKSRSGSGSGSSS